MGDIKIAVIGSEGFVGKQICKFFGEVQHYDKYFENRNLGYSKREVNNCDLAIICLPTEQDKDGSCNTQLVEEAIEWLETSLILIKSTITPGTTDYLKTKYNKRIVFSPEHCIESSYYNYYWKTIIETPFFIFGGDNKDIQPIVDEYIKRAGPEKKYIKTSAKIAEMSKYMVNTTLAARVALANEYYKICEAASLDWDEVRELWLLDPRIEKSHTAVFKDSQGFGGKCFPKDLAGLISYCNEIDIEPILLKAVNKYKVDNEE